MNFPNDENGDVLRRMYESGMDLSISYDVDFYHGFKEKNSAETMCREVENDFCDVKLRLSKNIEQDRWYVCCIVNIIPTHENITNREETFGKIAEKYNGYNDGWGVLQE